MRERNGKLCQEAVDFCVTGHVLVTLTSPIFHHTHFQIAARPNCEGDSLAGRVPFSQCFQEGLMSLLTVQ